MADHDTPPAASAPPSPAGPPSGQLPDATPVFDGLEPAPIAQYTRYGSYYRGEDLPTQGGQGLVSLAYHAMLPPVRPFVLKRIRPRAGANPAAVEQAHEQFLNEALALLTVEHPNVMDFREYGIQTDMRPSEPYIVMEYLRGVTLHELICGCVCAGLPLPDPEWTLRAMAAACDGAAAFHAAGLVHRDIKPANIMVCDWLNHYHDHVKVIDPGLVCEVQRVPQPNAVPDGSPLWMAPEQCVGPSRLDERTDVFGLGGVTYFALTGRPPARTAGRRPRPPHEVNPGLPPDLSPIILRALDSDPDERYPTAVAFAGALRGYAAAQ